MEMLKMTYSSLVETELNRALVLTRKDRKQRWVTMDGTIHETPVPYRDAISVCWMPIVESVTFNYRQRAMTHNAIGAL